jgi:gluconokinase
MFIVIMGVTGAGKTTVGKQLSSATNWAFFEADDYHPKSNIAKMAAGIALSDDDRQPWLERLGRLIDDNTLAGRNGVLACSALKEEYRQVLSPDGRATFVYLKATPDLVRERLAARDDHFMPAALIESQFATLEEPTRTITLDAGLPPDVLVHQITIRLGL